MQYPVRQNNAFVLKQLNSSSEFFLYRHNFIFEKYNFNNIMMQPNLVHIEHVLAVYSCRMNDVHVIYLVVEKHELS